LLGPTAGDVTLAPPAPAVRPAAPADELTAMPGGTAAEATLVRPALAPVAPRLAVGRLHDPSATDPDFTSDPDPVPASEADVTRTSPASGPGPSDPSAPAASAAAAGGLVGAAVDRYVLRGLHARGGLGEVYTARDTELNREVALKRIQTRYADEPSSRRRFLIEAELTARLDHPGVVPVFGLVADGRGRPCYAMRFIRGESLRDEIDRFHQREGTGATRPGTGTTEQTAPYSGGEAARPGADARPRPAAPQPADARRIAFRQLLQRFIAVCQAIAYAHTRKVIHRDIKPANVMVGTFGETLVVDWGLAKALDDVPNVEVIEQAAERAGFRRDPNATAVPDDHTAVGTAVGTPAYMSPEQAHGDLDRIGPASDIYSLGATLYCILTGKAPFGGTAPTETIKQVQKGEFSPPRELNPDVPPPLDAVCRKAMAVRTADRYATAQALAADVERWLSDEPVSCYRDPVFARLARWGRRNPARVAGTVSLLVTGLFATAAILFVVDRARKHTQEALDETTRARNAAQLAWQAETEAKTATKAALDDVTTQKGLTEKQRDVAEKARNLARDRFHLTRIAFKDVVLGIQARLEDRAGTQKLRQELLQTAQDGLRALLKSAAENPEADRQETDRMLYWARLQMGDVYKSLGDTALARTHFTSAVGMAEDLLKADPAAVDVRRDLAAGYDRLAEIDLQAGKTAGAAGAVRKALDLRERLLDLTPADRTAKQELAASRDRLAGVELERGNTREARAACTASLTTRTDLHAADPTNDQFTRDLARSHERDAEILLRMGDTTGAAKAVAGSLALRAGVAKTHPDLVEVQRELAAAYAALGEVNYARAEMGAAGKAYRDGLAVLDAVLLRDPLSAGAKLDAAVAHGRIGVVLLRTGDPAGAVTETRLSNKLCLELVDADRGSAKARRALAYSHEYLGDALLANGRAADAVEEYEKARAILEELAAADPDTVRAKADLAENQERMGTAQLAAGRLTEAMAAFTRSADIRDGVAKTDETSARARRQQAISQDRLCATHLKAGNHVRARVTAYKAFAAFRELADQDPGSGEAKRDLATAYAKWGEVAFEQEDLTATMILWHKSLAEFDTVARIDAGNAQAQEDRAAALERLARINRAAGYATAQLAAEQAALAVREKLAAAAPASPVVHRGVMTSLRRIGDALAEQRRFTDARQAYKAAQAVPARFGDKRVFAEEIREVADRLGVIEAVQVGMQNPAALADAPPDLQARALAVVVSEHLRQGAPVSAARAAKQLAATARGPDDLYLAARGYASAPGYAESAVELLKRAADAGFRDADELAGPAWDGVRTEKGFQDALAEIKKHLPLAPAPRAGKPRTD
ncbi:MAG: pknD 3, partial [Gemmataceae bacterium]|nr:pknD 3 [Gemmataceae bacterium]